MFKIGRENVQLKIKTVKSIRNRYLRGICMKLKRITETTKKLEGLTGELGLVSHLKKEL